MENNATNELRSRTYNTGMRYPVYQCPVTVFMQEETVVATGLQAAVLTIFFCKFPHKNITQEHPVYPCPVTVFMPEETVVATGLQAAVLTIFFL